MDFKVGDRVVYHYVQAYADEGYPGYLHKDGKSGVVVDIDEELVAVQFDFEPNKRLLCYEDELTQKEDTNAAV